MKSIFLESIENPKVATEITKETGAKVGGTLYADGLGEGDAGTYAGMFRHNVTTIVDGLKIAASLNRRDPWTRRSRRNCKRRPPRISVREVDRRRPGAR